MIKLVYVIKRRPDLSPEAFYDYWLNKHGPLVKSKSKDLRIVRYVQSHLIDHPANEAMRSLRGMLEPVDGITEVWWNSLEDMQAAYATAEGQAAGAVLAEDEAKFIDFSGSQVFMTNEHLIFDHTDGKGPGPEAVKVTYLLSRKAGMSQEACHRTWLVDHGPLVASFAGVSGMTKYVQSHTTAPEQNEAARASKNYLPPLDGITEVWLGSLDQLAPGAGTPESAKAALAMAEDERRFVEMGASRCFLTKEHLIFDHAPA